MFESNRLLLFKKNITGTSLSSTSRNDVINQFQKTKWLPLDAVRMKFWCPMLDIFFIISELRKYIAVDIYIQETSIMLLVLLVVYI